MIMNVKNISAVLCLTQVSNQYSTGPGIAINMLRTIGTIHAGLQPCGSKFVAIMVSFMQYIKVCISFGREKKLSLEWEIHFH